MNERTLFFHKSFSVSFQYKLTYLALLFETESSSLQDNTAKEESFLLNLAKEKNSLLASYGFAVSKSIEDISTYLEAFP